MVTVDTYREFTQHLENVQSVGPTMPYGWIDLSDIQNADWMNYVQMLYEFAPEIANTINSFRRYIRDLQAWASVIRQLSIEEKLEITIAFVDPLATIAVNLVNVIQARFIFASAHLCHQANKAKDIRGWHDDLPADRNIGWKVAHNYGCNWDRYDDFKKAVKSIGDEAFNDATGDFRNSYNHRFSPRFVVGMTNLVCRYVDKATGAVSYGFGGREPHELQDIARLLIDQHARCSLAFAAFQALVREHELAIREANTD